MKAVITDAEWKPGKRFAPLTSRRPMCVVPVLNEPIVQHTIQLLYKKGITEVIIAFSDRSGTEELESVAEVNRGKVQIHLYNETVPRGTAGVLKNIMPLIGSQPFLLIYSNLYIEDINLKGLMNFHDSKGAVVTVGVKHRTAKKEANIETVNISREGKLKDIRIIHHSIDRRSPWVSSGIYVLAPAIFNFIDGQKYFDIKEQLLPSLQEASLPVYAYEVEDYHRSIYGVEDYLALHRDLFDIKSRAIQVENKTQIAEEVWVGKDTVISPHSYLVSPVVLGNKCHIGDHVQIIGPVVIGDGCEIAEDAFVRESILWRNVTLKPKARSECCILAEGIKVPEGKRLRNFVVVDKLQADDTNPMLLNYNLIRVGESNFSPILSVDIKNWTYHFVKRIMDISIAFLCLLFFSPLLILIALMIKMSSSSPGPIFYIQKRCGKNGKIFEMFKFRTMVASAEEMQGELLAQSDIDGPMFKMTNDPRVTRLGKILRKTSLDELPQLVNVLRGEMSLVGPRPLIMEEMKFSPSWRNVRLMVKPGITGLWQIQGRSEAPFYDWIRYDVEYVMNQSLWKDIIILFKTIKVVFRKFGAY